MSTFHSVNASTGEALEGEFSVASSAEVDAVMNNARQAFDQYKRIDGSRRAEFLDKIAESILALGDELIQRAMAESGLPEGRLVGERGRTVNQLKMFAAIARKSEWVEAIIDTALPDREPLPRADIRKQLEPLGPVVVFGASNFPLAFSTAGGDTASALAAGCPVIVKAHPAHAGTSEMVASAIRKAASESGMPENVFQHVHDNQLQVGSSLVKHKHTKAVAFTGSLHGGRALFDMASNRTEPIPVFAEMGSINPVVLLPKELETEGPKWAETYAGSITLGAGQFCTNPGLILALKSDALDLFMDDLAARLTAMESQQMLHDGISNAYRKSVEEAKSVGVVKIETEVMPDNLRLAGAVLARCSDQEFLSNPKLHEEIFGPYSLVVECQDLDSLSQLLSQLGGQLTGTVIGTEEEIKANAAVVENLKAVVGRILFNGVPTGVEVGNAMHHGGPYPSTTDSRFTSVGADAIKRFARPVCYQNCPHDLLPETLKNENPLSLMRKVNGTYTTDSI